MDIVEYLDMMNKIQNMLHEYIDSENGIQENFNRFIKLLKDHKIQDDKHKLSAVIQLISIIINYHYRTASFFDKIFKIIIYLKDDIKKYYTNREIFGFFTNKKVLLFLFREKILSFNKSLISKLMENNNNYWKNFYAISYLYPETKQYIDEKNARKFEVLYKVPDNLEELRETEYSDNYILQLIQKDLIDEFILYINTNKFDLDEEIENSLILETNLFLEQSKIQTAIEYSAFFGSIKIFKYLFAQKCELNPDLLLFAIHGRNTDIIHILEENIINSDDETSNKMYEKCLSFAIKCHHNEFVDYLIENHIKNENISTFVYEKSLKYFNYSLIQPEKVNSDSFYEVCIRNHYNLAKCLLCKDKNIDINSLITKKEKNRYNRNISITKKTALFSSISLGYIDIVQLLLENKDIDVNKKSFDDCQEHKEFTPLFIAVNHREKEIVSLLLDHKDIDVNMKSIHDKEEEAPLNAAISNDDDEIVQLLLNHKNIDINLRSLKYDEDFDECTSEFYREVTPLYQAAGFCNNPKVIQLLLDQKNIDINAIINIREEQYYTSTGERFEPRQIEDSALYIAVYNHKLENVRILLTQENIDVNFKNKLYRNNKLSNVCSILERAVYARNLNILKLLLDDKRFNVNEKCMFGLMSGDFDPWDEEEIKKNKNDNIIQHSGSGWSRICLYKEKISILHLAIDLNKIEAVRLLLENENIDVNILSFEKRYDHTLKSSGEEMEEKKLVEKTPLYFAIEQGYYEIVKLLIEHKNIDINKKSKIYVWKNKISSGKEDDDDDIAYKNQEEEEDLNEEEEKFEQGVKEVNKEETALHMAVAKGKLKIIKLLLSNKNIDINITDKHGRKPIELTHKEKVISLFNQLA